MGGHRRRNQIPPGHDRLRAPGPVSRAKNILGVDSREYRSGNEGLKPVCLFGGSTLAAAKAGAQVVHLDASKGMVEWARENADLNGLEKAPIRWIVDDAIKFLKREVKRGNLYDAIILDPPSLAGAPPARCLKSMSIFRTF